MIEDAKNIHFIGIGGIGISAIARMMLLEGKNVSGSDGNESQITEELKKLGVTVYIGHAKEHVGKNTNLVIYTIAISEDNPELLVAKRLKIPTLTYPQALGLVSKEKYTIAVAGTHGKTTTTAMIAKVMIESALDPTVIVGSLMRNSKKSEESSFSGGNLIVGNSKYLVAEACEFKRSFLNLQPNIIVITNIDNDHLDYYKDINDIVSAFREFALKLNPDDYLVCNLKQKNISAVVAGLKCNVVDYGSFFEKNLRLKIPGEHNRQNAGAVLAVASILGISREKAFASLKDFGGTWRRFEFRGESKSGVLVYDDYAHHPTEIRATLAGARELFSDKKILVIFQPHLYSRTKLLLREFSSSFLDANKLVILPIYAARESFDPSVTSDILAKEIGKNSKPEVVCSEKAGVGRLIRENASRGDVVITMGAGDVHYLCDSILKI